MNLLPLWTKSPCHPHLFAIIILSVLTSILLQLSSTLLLTDLATGTVRSFPNSTIRAVYPHRPLSGIREIYSDPWVATVPTYPLFAESSQYDQPEHPETVDDTGPAIRALLPVPADEGRSKLLSFDGNATLYDSRCICTQPFLQSLSLEGDVSVYPVLSVGSLQFSGYVNHSVFIPSMISTGFAHHFNCSIPTISSVWTEKSWAVATCFLGRGLELKMGIISNLEGAYGSSIFHTHERNSDMDNEGLPYNTHDNVTYQSYSPDTIGDSWLVINITNLPYPRPQKPVIAPKYRISFTESWTSISRGPWARITSTQEDAFSNEIQGPVLVDWPFALDVSICSNAVPWLKNMHINAERHAAVEEPVSQTAGIKQISANGMFLNPEERGIMTLNATELLHQLSQERREIVSSNASFPSLPVFHFDLAMIDRLWGSSIRI
jgi:hypothetical protein